MREGRPSYTAAWVAAMRGLSRSPSDHHGGALDHVARDLVPQPYAWALDLADRFPGVWERIHHMADRASFYHFSHVGLRTRAIDEGVHEAIRRGARQLVLLGAGLDARAWRLSDLRDSVVFEVDHPSTQAYKRKKIGARPSLAREVRFVAVDFERDALDERLVGAGYDPGVLSVFVWEGVTMYLLPESVDYTLSQLSSLIAPGGSLLVTYGQRHHGRVGTRAVRWLVRRSGEPFRALYTKENMAGLLGRHGFDVVADEGLDDWVRRYFGAESGRGTVERLVRAVRV
ncbi:class I SAM-dependent methyltransferase [Pendulispora albinea]|uniref:S-adenosyl-L-methionine-dependent methyltransferase n=1 Tax=Pendulispora albinea TaxID=2741071 RepID=A0ABZ2LKA6_9BACT